MSIIHFDTTNAAGSTEGQLQYPSNGWQLNAGGQFFSAGATLILYGEGETGPGGNPGEWQLFDTGDPDSNGVWLTNNGDGIENWLFRTIDITQDEGSIPGQTVYYPGQWTGGRTDWIALGTGTGIQQISSQTSPDWSVGSSYGEGSEEIVGFIEFCKYPRDTVDVTFDSSDVNTGTDRITITGHGFVVGDQAVYIVPDGETGIAGTDGFDTDIVDNEFVSIIIIDANTIQLASNLAGADDTPVPFNLTGTGTGTGHILRKLVPATSTSGGSNEVDLRAAL